MNRYKKPLDSITMEGLKTRHFAKSSNRKYNWACKAYSEWRLACIETSDQCPSFIVQSDIWKPEQLDKKLFCEALCHFITEFRKCNKKEYPPNTVRELIKLLQMYLKSKKVHW